MRPEYTQIRFRSQKSGSRAQGDPEALKPLFGRGQLFACALRILPRLQDAKDAVQDFLTGATSIGKERDRGPLSAGNQAKDEMEQSFSGDLMEDGKPAPEQIYRERERGRIAMQFS